MKTKIFFTCLFAVALLVSCAPAGNLSKTEAAVSTSPNVTETAAIEFTATPASTNTATPIPATSTPAIPDEPAVDVGLSVENNAEMVFENDAWVVKNANGDVTATWAGTEWTYNMNVIKVSQTIIGFDGQDAALLAALLTTPLADDTPELHFTDPVTGAPLPYGYVREEAIQATSTEDVAFEIPVSMFAVRMLGTVNVDDLHTAIVLEMPVGVDRSIIFTFNENAEQGMVLYLISDENFAGENSLLEIPAAIFISTTNPDLFNVDLRGRQMLIGIYHDIPDTFYTAYAQWDINSDCETLLKFIEDPTAAVPVINFVENTAKMLPFWSNTLWIPATIDETPTVE